MLPPLPIRIPAAPEDPRAETHLVAMRDGTRLATDVYRAQCGDQRGPVVLIRLPYDKVGRYTFIPEIASYFAAHGFTCVAQDVRGKYRSEGTRTPFVHEATDGWDTVNWIVDQPWSNGIVGTWGDSYYGFTQWALASRQHPAHLAMVPRVTGHRFGDMRPGGGLPTRTLLEWVVEAWAAPELIDDGAFDPEVATTADAVHRSLGEAPRLLAGAMRAADQPDAWAKGVFPEGDPAALLTIPALHMGGWFDNLQFWQLDDWAASSSAPAADHQFLRMWTNDHEDYRWRDLDQPLVHDFGSDRDALARHLPLLLDETISFFDHYLRGRGGRWAAPRVAYEHARLGTRTAAQWPPLDTETRSFGLSAANALVPDAGAGVATWSHDPANPVPFPIASEWSQNRDGLPDESALHERADVMVFEGSAMAQPLDLVGPASIDFSIEADTPTTHVIARLCDVRPDGRATCILGNAVEVPADGTPTSLRLGDTAYRLPQGHRLRLAISTSLHGQYDVLGAGQAAAGGQKPQVQHLQLEHAALRVTVARTGRG